MKEATQKMHVPLRAWPIMSLAQPSSMMNFEFVQKSASPNTSLHQALSWLHDHRQELPCTRFAVLRLPVHLLSVDTFMSALNGGFFSCVPSVTKTPLFIAVDEHEIVRNSAPCIKAMNQLASHGVNFLLDRVGAGHSSFRVLKELPLAALRIDASLITPIQEHAKNLSIVESLAQLGRNFGLTLIASGVDAPATLEVVADLEINYAQGAAIAPIVDLESVLSIDSNRPPVSSASFATESAVKKFISG